VLANRFIIGSAGGMIGATDSSRRAESVISSASAFLIHRFDIGHAPSRCFSAVFRYRFEPFAASPDRVVLPSLGPATLLGFPSAPFAGLLPHRVDGHFGSSGPTCLFVRTRVPIDFRRVIRASCETWGRSACDRIGFWASVPFLRSVSTSDWRSLLADRSCLGLCLLQGLRTH
jgi:hypothetical protein